jgi:hypothetical protein
MRDEEVPTLTEVMQDDHLLPQTTHYFQFAKLVLRRWYAMSPAMSGLHWNSTGIVVG